MTSNELLADFVEDDELAAANNRHVRTIHRWSDQPDGLPFLKLGNKRIYHLPTVREWMLRRMHRPNLRRGGQHAAAR
jgi:hypothetical protein